MAATVTISPLSSPLKTTLVVITDLEGTLVTDVTGATGAIRAIDIDNTTGGASLSYLKIFDAKTGTLATTAPDWIFDSPAGTRQVYVIDNGCTFSNGLSLACVKEPGTPGTSNPDAAVNVRLIISAS
jgi:hypothetical protein